MPLGRTPKRTFESAGMSLAAWGQGSEGATCADAAAGAAWSKAKAGAAKAPAPEGAGKPMDLLIRRLTLSSVAVHYADRGSFKGDVPVVASLKKVEVREINAKTAGKDISEQLVGQVFESVVLAIAKESAGKLPDMLGKGLQQSVEAGGRLGNQAIDAIGGAAKGAGDAVGGFLKGIGDAIGGKKQ